MSSFTRRGFLLGVAASSVLAFAPLAQPASIVNTSISAATTAESVTPSDTAVFGVAARAIYVGVTGDVTVHMAGGGNATFVAVPAGALLPIAVDQVLSTGTTASSLLLLR